jgi:hypothetical protein
MEHQLSPLNEQFLDQIVAGGLFPSKEAALDAAMGALREKTDAIEFVCAEHMEAVEEGIADADAGLCDAMTEDDWAELKKLAHDVAAGVHQGEK